MLFLVRIPSLPKRIQQNAESPEEAAKIVFERLPERLRKDVQLSDCSAEFIADPMTQFGRSETENDDGSI
jgi:hypothetical protein